MIASSSSISRFKKSVWASSDKEFSTCSYFIPRVVQRFSAFVQSREQKCAPLCRPLRRPGSISEIQHGTCFGKLLLQQRIRIPCQPLQFGIERFEAKFSHRISPADRKSTRLNSSHSQSR